MKHRTGPVVIAQIVRIEPTRCDAVLAEQAWRDGDVLGAIEAADRALAAGTDSEGRAAGVAAAGAAADGALLDAAARWRGVGGALDGAAAARAAGRAALAAALAGDITAAVGDLATARDQLPDPAPRGLTVLLGGAGAVIEAVGGALDKASRHLAGLAAASVAPDPMAAERLDELAVILTAAGGDLEVARALLRAHPRRADRTRAAARRVARPAHGPPRRRPRGAHGRGPHPAAAPRRAARRGRDRRAGPPQRRRRRHRGHLGAGRPRRRRHRRRAAAARRVGRAVRGRRSRCPRPTATSSSTRCAPRCAAQARPGGAWPSTCGGSSSGPSSPATPPQPPTPRPDSPRSPHTTRGCAAGPRRPSTWAAVLAGRVCPETVDAAAARLADDGLRDEAAALCRAAAQRTSDPAATRRLLGAGRGLRPGPGGPRAAGLLSEREREVGALVLDGLTQKEIGARLYISPKTVEQHVARMRQKLAASNRATLVAALRTHL